MTYAPVNKLTYQKRRKRKTVTEKRWQLKDGRENRQRETAKEIIREEKYVTEREETTDKHKPPNIQQFFIAFSK